MKPIPETPTLNRQLALWRSGRVDASWGIRTRVEGLSRVTHTSMNNSHTQLSLQTSKTTEPVNKRNKCPGCHTPNGNSRVTLSCNSFSHSSLRSSQRRTTTQQAISSLHWLCSLSLNENQFWAQRRDLGGEVKAPPVDGLSFSQAGTQRVPLCRRINEVCQMQAKHLGRERSRDT